MGSTPEKRARRHICPVETERGRFCLSAPGPFLSGGWSHAVCSQWVCLSIPSQLLAAAAKAESGPIRASLGRASRRGHANALLLSACHVQAWPGWPVLSPPLLHCRQGALGSLAAGPGQGKAWSGQVRAVTGSLYFGVSGPPTEKPRGGVAAEDAVVCGLRSVLLRLGHCLLALPGSWVR